MSNFYTCLKLSCFFSCQRIESLNHKCPQLLLLLLFQVCKSSVMKDANGSIFVGVFTFSKKHGNELLCWSWSSLVHSAIVLDSYLKKSEVEPAGIGFSTIEPLFTRQNTDSRVSSMLRPWCFWAWGTIESWSGRLSFTHTSSIDFDITRLVPQLFSDDWW